MKFADYYKADSPENCALGRFSPTAPGTPAQKGEIEPGQFPLEFQAQGKNVMRFLCENAGLSFNDSLYRIAMPGDIESLNSLIAGVFPDFASRAICFAYDWLGRVFALDRDRVVNKALQVVVLDPTSAEAYEIPCSLLAFHNEELINYRQEALAEDLYKDWRETGHSAPAFDQCISYITPLFMGGDEIFENMLPSSLEIYWQVCSDMLNELENDDFDDEID